MPLGHLVGDGEDGLAVAKADRQPARVGQPAAVGRDAVVSAGEVGEEALEVARARAAPAVDGLARVAHRGDGVAGVERGQQDALRLTGVLVLVEQHGPEPGALDLTDLRVLPRDAGRDRDLVAVVHDAPLSLQRVIALDHRQHVEPGVEAGEQLGERRHPAGPLPAARGSAARWDRASAVRAAHLGRLAQVLGELAGEREHVAGDAADGTVDGVHRPVVGLDDLRRSTARPSPR